MHLFFYLCFTTHTLIFYPYFTTYMFIYTPNYNLYKIGCSKTPKKRVKFICKTHIGTILLIVINGNIEIPLHRRFEHKRATLLNEREWFKLDKSDISYLESL